ncbi:MAG: DNA gyrase subunit A [Thermomicrobiales bacterium]|nr:DNA gyrase subunit A [Thermomicrobiales bacterium]MCO5223852.1 DNA gyrase subunit A [Thermomicrobiales bacterium]MCO5227416.1 DNA gyrase subunit A [Thermomicrobiales bacterium]
MDSIGTVRIASIAEEMQQSYLDYAMSVIIQRALPDARDGLKPVHRRVLYAMNEMGLRSNTRYRKSAGIVGEVIKSYHPHGDQAAYDTLVRMAQDFSLRYPLVDGQGNFGSVDGDSAAAMRYTEAKLTPIADEMMLDIDKNTVDMIPNYDNSMMQPAVLPARVPNLLINGSSGIAVGMATNIPSHNLGEICDAVAALIENPDITLEELLEIVPGPDFPTGGTILGREGIQAAYATGRGRVVMRAKAFTEEQDRGGRFQIVVTELPYQVNKANLLEKIADMVREGKLDGISGLRDESDRNGMRMVIELKRDAQPIKVLNNLFKHTQLQQTFGVNMLALVENGTQPRVLTLKRALNEFVSHRQIVITRRTEFELDRARRRAHILEGLKIALDNIDEVIATIRRSRDTETARKNLMRGFKLSELQAQAILDMRLARLAALERQKIEAEYKEVLATIEYLEGLLAHPERILGLIKDDMADLKARFGDARRTRIQDVSGSMSVEDLIPEVDVLVTITDRGYIKRVTSDVYQPQGRGGRGKIGATTREEDQVKDIVSANTMDSLLVFTNRGRVYQMKVHELPDSGRTNKGLPIQNVVNMLPDESVATMMPIRDFDQSQYLFFATRRGTVKRVSLEQFKAVRSNGLIAITLDPDDELAWVRQTDGKSDVILVTTGGQAIRFKETDVRPMGRPAAGVIGIRMDAGDHVVAFEAIEPDHDLLVVAELGLGKRTDIEEYRSQGRGGKGIQAMRLTARTGKIAGAVMVHEDDTVVMMNSAGVVIKMAASSIRRIGRTTQGVRLQRLEENQTIRSVTAEEPKDPAAAARLAELPDE